MPLPPRFKKSSATATLIPWLKVVPRAAPVEPICSGPINRQSSTILQTQATAIKYMGRLLSPIPRKMALMMLYAVIKGTPKKHTVR